MNSSSIQQQFRVPELDGIRGLAISLVLFDHFVAYSVTSGTGMGSFLRRTLSLGGSGVDLFFVLSGFLIGGILIDQRNSEHYFKAFYVRRCCRILPPYLLSIVLYLALRLFLNADSSQKWFEELFVQGGMPLWANLTFAQNYYQVITGHYNPDWLKVNWSLALEEQFYLILPLAVWLLRPSRLVKIVFVLACLNPLVQLFLCICDARTYLAVGGLIPIRADALLIGFICAFLLRQQYIHTWLARNGRSFKTVFVFLLLGLVYVFTKYDLGPFEYERILFFNLWIAMFYACLLLLVVTDKNGIVSAAIRCSALRNLGTISYSVYLFHMPINGLIHGLLLGRDWKCSEPADFLATAAALIVTLLFATLLWHVFERPMVTWGHSFIYNAAKDETAK